MRLLIGLDDTDNLESRGTGHRARQMGLGLQAENLGLLKGITRHQLLVAPEIPYTSHNSSACLLVETSPERLPALTAFCRAYLLAESAPGSDAGLCIASWEQASPAVIAFGRLAKEKVLTPAAAVALAEQEVLYLEGLTGTGGGIIGSLAAVGLRREGCDGRFLWLPGLRELPSDLSVAEVCQMTGIEEIRPLAGSLLPPDQRVTLGDWVRPIMVDGKITLYVEEIKKDDQLEWRVLPRENLKRLSQ